MKILYVHGFLGHENGSASKAIRELFPNDEVYAPAIPFINPKEAVKFVEEKAKEYDLLIASSLGCLFSLRVRNIPKILINIAFKDTIDKIYDESKKDNPNLPDKKWYLQELESITPQHAWERNNKDVDIYSQNNVYYIFGENDTIAQNDRNIDRLIESEHALGSYEALDPFSRYDLPYDFDENGLDINPCINIVIAKGMEHKFDSNCSTCLKAIEYCANKLLK